MKNFIQKSVWFSTGVMLTLATTAIVGYATSNPFPDVGPNEWYSRDVYAMRDLGVISGYSDGRFGPNDNVTRAQVAAMMNRYHNVFWGLYAQVNGLRQFHLADLKGKSWSEYEKQFENFPYDMFGGVEGFSYEYFKEHAVSVYNDPVIQLTIYASPDWQQAQGDAFFYIKLDDSAFDEGSYYYGPFYDNLSRLLDEVRG